MKPRPFYRWKSFWLGLCVLVFLGWAWRDSYNYFTSAVVGWKGWEVSLTALRGEARVSMEFGGGLRGMFEAEGERLTLRPDTAEGMYHDFDSGISGVPQSVLFVVFLAFWFAWLYWHWKREQKKSS